MPRPLQGMKHAMETSGWPVFAEVCRLDADKLSAAEMEFQALEAAGIIRRSKVVLTSSCGVQAWWLVEALWQLLPHEHDHDP